MVTILDALRGELASATLSPPAKESNPQLDAAYRAVVKAFADVQQSQPSLGYEPWFRGDDYSLVAARDLAHRIVSRGNRQAKEAKDASKIFRSVKYLSGTAGYEKTWRRHIELLWSAFRETSILDQYFIGDDRAYFEFASMVERAAADDRSVQPQLQGICRGLVRAFPVKRGRRITPASAAHKFFLQIANSQGKSGSYTWNDVTEEFTDSRTRATAREFDVVFDPRPAVRSLRKDALSQRQRSR